MIRISFFAASLLCLHACMGQTAQPEPLEDGSYISEDGLKLTPVAKDLAFPWGLAAMPNGDLLVTEREGDLRLVSGGALVETPISGLPDDILVERQGGLLGLTLDPDFETNRTLYLSYSKDMGETNSTAVVSARLSDDAMSLENVTEIFVGEPRTTFHHYGSRLAFLPDGTLLVGLGDGYRYLKSAQDSATLHGKMVRINTDGTLPEDNPYAAEDGHPAIYSIGHRNIQGLIYDSGRDIIFAHEHGPKGGDELNVIEPGLNYGWPEISYGINYDGTIITDQTTAPGMEQPAVKWVPSIAPSGMALVKTAGFEAWSDDLLIGAMNGPDGQKLVRVDLNDAGEVVETVDLLTDLGIAYRDVISTPEAIYLATADLDGVVYKLELTE